MTKILILTKRSFLIIFLVSNAVNTLYASPYTQRIAHTTCKAQTDLHVDIKERLVSKGLLEDAAAKKADKLLDRNKNTLHKLSYLYSENELMFSKEKVMETLATYALFESSLDLSSYESMVGFAQHISPSLGKEQLLALKHIADIS